LTFFFTAEYAEISEKKILLLGDLGGEMVFPNSELI